MESILYCLLLSSSFGIVCLSEAAEASEWCQFQQGQTSVLAFCEQGCCSSQCCQVDSAKRLHMTILVAVCAAAGLIIIGLMAISLVCVFKDKKRDRDKEWEETGKGATPAGSQTDTGDLYSSPPSPSSLHQQTTFITDDDVTDQNHHTWPKNSIRRHSSGRPSLDAASLRQKDIEDFTAPSNQCPSGCGDKEFGLVKEAESNHMDGRRGSVQSLTKSVGRSSGRRRSSTIDHRQELSEAKLHEQTRGKASKSVGGKHSHSLRRRSEPIIRDTKKVFVAGVTSSIIRPSTSHPQRVVSRQDSKVSDQEEGEFSAQHPLGINHPRLIHVRHSDGFLDMKTNDIPLTSILRPMSVRNKRPDASVHFEQENS